MKSTSIFISIIALTLTLSSCSQAPLPQYSIIKETPNVALSKNNLQVRLEQKIDKETLTRLAHSLREDRKQYERLWIQYFLPETSLSGVWATSSFTPSGIDININGSTSEEDELTSTVENIKGEIFGKWRSENSLMGATLVMYKTLQGETITRTKFDFKTKSRSEEVLEVPAGALIMQVTHKDGSQSKKVLSTTDVNGKKRYDYENEHGEYYHLEANGNLGLCGQDGKFDEAIKIE